MSARLLIGGMIFAGMDQADFTAPFEVLSRLPDSQFLVLAKVLAPIRDNKGLILTPEVTFAESPTLDVLLVPGGFGVNALMEDEGTLDFVRTQAKSAKLVISVCTGALICGAAGLLMSRRATTHWASHHLLPYFGAIPDNARVVVDGNVLTTAGVTSGIDGALRAAAMLCGDETAQGIQLYMQYAPEPPFSSGTPESAPTLVLDAVTKSMASTTETRNTIARRVAEKLGVSPG